MDDSKPKESSAERAITDAISEHAHAIDAARKNSGPRVTISLEERICKKLRGRDVLRVDVQNENVEKMIARVIAKYKDKWKGKVADVTMASQIYEALCLAKVLKPPEVGRYHITSSLLLLF